jgi:hypothetical protein
MNPEASMLPNLDDLEGDEEEKVKKREVLAIMVCFL